MMHQINTLSLRGVGDDAAARQADEKNKGVVFQIVFHSPFVLVRSIIPK